MRLQSARLEYPSVLAVLPLASFALALGVAGCATPANPNPERTATRLAQTYGPACEANGPVNSQAWGYCVAGAYNRAVGRHGGACTDWQLQKAASYEDCVMNATVRDGGVTAATGSGPYCIALNTGGDVNYGACR